MGRLPSAGSTLPQLASCHCVKQLILAQEQPTQLLLLTQELLAKTLSMLQQLSAPCHSSRCNACS